MSKRLTSIALAALVIVVSSASAQDKPAETVVLDSTSLWRVYYEMKSPVVRTADGLRTMKSICETPPPGNGWTQPGFDDNTWVRVPGLAPPYAWRRWGRVSRRPTVHFLSVCLRVSPCSPVGCPMRRASTSTVGSVRRPFPS